MNITGKWEKTTNKECDNKYPDIIEFKPDNLYQAEIPPTATMHPLWDVGTFKIVKDKIHISTSNDAIVAYTFSLTEKMLVIKDVEGCIMKFQRIQ